MKGPSWWVWCMGMGIWVFGSQAGMAWAKQAEPIWAKQVIIYRDAWGVAHIQGPSLPAVVFGYGYVQAEDHFPLLEDLYMLALGRYSQVHGPRGLNSDLLNRAFRVVPLAQREYHELPPKDRQVVDAFVAGINYYLQTHPEEPTPFLKRFEPWFPLAFSRQVAVELLHRYSDLHHNYVLRRNPAPATFGGSNAWAVAPRRTASGRALLAAMPHQPLFGLGMLYEVHLVCQGKWNFFGVGLLGAMLPSMGHNEHLGWAMTTNEPDVADLWRVVFDHPQDPLLYRYAEGYRRAESWKETVLVRQGRRLQSRQVEFRSTCHGPIVKQEGPRTFLAMRIAGAMDSRIMAQTVAMIRARNWEEFYAALRQGHYPIFNFIYADRWGNIAYVYNGRVPRRSTQFNWRQALDGSDPRTQWQGFHSLDELPQVVNPPSGYVQNCNNSPFFTTEEGNPDPKQFPSYMFRDAHWDLRRAKRSRQILGQLKQATFEQMCRLVFDTKMYWAAEALPRYKEAFQELQKTHPQLARRVKPLLEHLLEWDGRCTVQSTAATLCEAWYRRMYGQGYPGEVLLPRYESLEDQFRALVEAARELRASYGSWKVPWGQVFRIQRPAQVVPDLYAVRFDDRRSSLASPGVPGPLGAIFTHYYTPVLPLGWLLGQRRRYAVVGASYLGVYEFGPRVRGASLVQFGTSGRPQSPHFFDQAHLLVKRQLKPELFYWSDVVREARWVYRPGERWRRVDSSAAPSAPSPTVTKDTVF